MERAREREGRGRGYEEVGIFFKVYTVGLIIFSPQFLLKMAGSVCNLALRVVVRCEQI